MSELFVDVGMPNNISGGKTQHGDATMAYDSKGPQGHMLMT